MQRYVIEYIDEVGHPHAAYFNKKDDAELFFGTLHSRGLTFYLEGIVIDKPEFKVFRRLKQFHPATE